MEICSLCDSEKLKEEEYASFYDPIMLSEKRAICNNCLKSDINLLFLVKKYNDIIFEHRFSYMEISSYIVGKLNSKV